jgi:hypothetical protein
MPKCVKAIPMISELMKYYIFDKLDKQILSRIPYSLFFSLLIYLFFNMEKILFPLSVCSLFAFLILTVLFNWHINRNLENPFVDVEFKKTIEKMSQIFEGKSSLLDDIKISEKWWTVILAVGSGLSFFLLCTSAFLMVFNYLKIGKDLIVVAMIFVTIYLYQDLAKSDFLEEIETTDVKFPFLLDLLEMYTVRNSLKSLPVKKSVSQVIVLSLSRVVGPLTYLTLPKLSFDILIVYKNPELVELIKDLTGKSEGIYLKYEDGQSLDSFLAEERSEKITTLYEKSPKENFPYLFNPNYSYSDKDQKRWIAFRILENGLKNRKAVGCIFIHLFKGVFIKRKVKGSGRRPIKVEPKPMPVFLFIFVGERSYIHFIKTKIEVISTKFPLNILNVEYGI